MLQRWARQLVTAAAFTLVALAVQRIFFGSTARWVLFYPAVFASAWFGGFGAGMLAAVLTGMALVWFVIPPAYTFYMSSNDIFMASTFFAMSTLMSFLLHKVRRTAEERLIFAAMIENSADFIGVADPQGRPIYLNPAGREMIGLDPGFDIRRTTIYDYYAPEDQSFARGSIAAEVRQRGHWQGETRFLNWKTGETFPVWHNRIYIRDPKSGRHLGGGTITRDLTEQKRFEEELRKSEARLRDAERVAHLGSWTWDLTTDTVHWSDELRRMFRWDPLKPVPKLFDENTRLFLPESSEKVRAAVVQLFEHGEPMELELDARLPDGHLLTVSAHAEAVRNANGHVVRINATALDITELKNLQRLRDEWTSVIAHDLRQPIGFIMMAASALADVHAGPMNDDERQLTNRMAAAGRNLARMVDDLLAVSLLEAHRLVLERQWANPRMLVDEAIVRGEHLADDRPVRISQSDTVRDVYVDPMRVGQVLGNLLSNAVKYGAPGTPIDVRIEQRDAEVEIAISNTGDGISAEELPRLFGRYVRSKHEKARKVRGVGLGLYICKELVEAHHGRISVDSVPGKTTTFRITLPSREVSSRAA